MDFLRHNWFYLAGVLFVILAFLMPFAHLYFSPLQIILICSFMALLAHQFEEYVFPGGAALVINIGVRGEKENFRRFPGNTQVMLVVNLSAYVIYVTAIFFPQYIWLGLGTIFFNFIQIIAHGFQMNRALKTWYNAGLATAIFLFLPIGVYYLIFITQNQIVSTEDWFGGIAAFVLITAFLFVVPFRLFEDKNSPYLFPEWQVKQFYKVKEFASLKNKEKN